MVLSLRAISQSHMFSAFWISYTFFCYVHELDSHSAPPTISEALDIGSAFSSLLPLHEYDVIGRILSYVQRRVRQQNLQLTPSVWEHKMAVLCRICIF